MLRVDHIGIAVENLSTAIEKYQNLLKTDCFKTEFVEAENVEVAFFKTENVNIELLEGKGPENTISKFVAKRGQGIHHIALDVKNIEIAIQEFEQLGFEFINKTPKKGGHNKMVCFMHPKSTNGVLFELCETIKNNND
ncbi:MAG: methylmalonyl-CoA epimerase [Sediminibacterium sp.]|nr:methylmalonyl-CoA epimerase [Sediminibacterium sp.]